MSNTPTAHLVRRAGKRLAPVNSRLSMTRAWAMVRRAHAVYGGGYREYLAAALRLAWAEINADPVVITARALIARLRSSRLDRKPPALSAGLLRAAARRRDRLGSFARHAW